MHGGMTVRSSRDAGAEEPESEFDADRGQRRAPALLTGLVNRKVERRPEKRSD